MNRTSRKRFPWGCVVFLAGAVLGFGWHALWVGYLPGIGLPEPAERVRHRDRAPQSSKSHVSEDSKDHRVLDRDGRWHRIEGPAEDSALSEDQKALIDQLNSIGYLTGSKPAPEEANVVRYDRARACEGLNLVVSGHAPEAELLDMEGKTLHRWSCDIGKAFPDYAPSENPENDENNHTYWRKVRLMKNGDLFAIFEGIGLVRLDKDSNVVWKTRNGAHHDLEFGPDGEIYLLTRLSHINPTFNADKPVLEDFISVLTPDGDEIRKVSILDLIRNSPYSVDLTKQEKEWGDILHTNTIERVRENSGLPSPFAPGCFLISIRELDLVCLIDADLKRVLWGESDLWRRQHQPTLLGNGRILVFDNEGEKETSRVIEFEPLANRIVWTYGGTPERPFYTPTCGSCQRLKNGNTLIAESDSGRAFEVTPEGEIVWEYFNPHRAGERDELIATLFEIARIDSDWVEDWLER
ncbi:aryl-sulfate sulfotransferase [Candidatus Sumerlaeota bacterium]|nr:aryl-sulfate sulfotransferase [Candidatus Sumerlaeota bacterium]